MSQSRIIQRRQHPVTQVQRRNRETGAAEIGL